MSTIRPPIFPTPQPPAQGAGPARSAAQRAFFEAAMGRTATSAQQQAQPQQPSAPVHRMPASLPADPPTRILRPGSILDIKV